MDPNRYRFETLQLHAGQERPDAAAGARAVPIYMTTSYVFGDCAQAAARYASEDGGHIYSRLSNPTNDAFEARLAALEGGAACVSAVSGSAALALSVMNIARAGDTVVSDRCIYGGSYNLLAHTLPDFGIRTIFVDGSNPANFEAAITENTRLLFIETIGNPNATLVDVDAVAAVAHRHGLPLFADNTFATPYLFRPIEHGADIVLHSATKFIGGHGTAIGGAVVDAGRFDWAAGHKFPGLSAPNDSAHGAVFADLAGSLAFSAKLRGTVLRDTSSVLSPFHAFLYLQGLETLSLRVERHVENTLKVVEFLASHPGVASVSHPSLPGHPSHALYNKYFPNGGASIFTVNIKGGQAEAWRFIERLKLFSLLANVADVKSLAIHPASTTHAQLTETELREQGIGANTVRLSVGVEHIDDILEDLAQALA